MNAIYQLNSANMQHQARNIDIHLKEKLDPAAILFSTKCKQ